MAYYTKNEQETILIFEAKTGKWRVYSTVPTHIKKITELSKNVRRTEIDQQGRIVAIDAILTTKQVRMVHERKVSQKQLEHLEGMRK